MGWGTGAMRVRWAQRGWKRGAGRTTPWMWQARIGPEETGLKGLTEDTRDEWKKPSPWESPWRPCQNPKKGPLLEKWAVLPAGDVWQLAATTRWEGCYRHLAGTGRGCCIAQARVQQHTHYPASNVNGIKVEKPHFRESRWERAVWNKE